MASRLARIAGLMALALFDRTTTTVSVSHRRPWLNNR